MLRLAATMRPRHGMPAPRMRFVTHCALVGMAGGRAGLYYLMAAPQPLHLHYRLSWQRIVRLAQKLSVSMFERAVQGKPARPAGLFKHGISQRAGEKASRPACAGMTTVRHVFSQARWHTVAEKRMLTLFQRLAKKVKANSAVAHALSSVPLVAESNGAERAKLSAALSTHHLQAHATASMAHISGSLPFPFAGRTSAHIFSFLAPPRGERTWMYSVLSGEKSRARPRALFGHPRKRVAVRGHAVKRDRVAKLSLFDPVRRQGEVSTLRGTIHGDASIATLFGRGIAGFSQASPLTLSLSPKRVERHRAPSEIRLRGNRALAFTHELWARAIAPISRRKSSVSSFPLQSEGDALRSPIARPSLHTPEARRHELMLAPLRQWQERHVAAAFLRGYEPLASARYTQANLPPIALAYREASPPPELQLSRQVQRIEQHITRKIVQDIAQATPWRSDMEKAVLAPRVVRELAEQVSSVMTQRIGFERYRRGL